ncbi:hypothetical protein ACOXXX_16480 [Thalassococcus sp. BH17M4-6]|uniref:hypothetical protein n=1 Tax=Thalassococcus sp. BH17M4-6 TaxID=3413148 RepID=UPI003BECCDDB
MEEKTIAAGVVSLVVGFALGNVTAGSGPDMSEIEAMISDKVTASTDAVSGMASGVEEQFAALGDRLSGLEDQMGAATDTSAMDDLRARLDTLASDLQSGMAEQTDAVASRIAALGDQIGAATSNAAADSGESASTATETPDETETTDTAQADGDAALSVGQTVMLAEGLRVFVSRITEDGARAVVNGDVVMLETGGSTTVNDCEVTLDSVADRKAQFSANCDAASSGGGAESSGETAADDGADDSADEGTRMGEIALLGDGAARVFLSGIAADGSTVRVAVNSLSVQRVAAGEAIPVGEDGCSVTVDEIQASSVKFSYGCES